MRPIALAVLALAPFLAFAEDAPDDDYATRVADGKKWFFEKGNLWRATHELREAMRLRPDRIEAYRGLGAALVKKGERERGIFLLNEARRRSPSDGLTLYWLGLAWTNEKKAGPAWYYLNAAKAQLKPADYPDAAAYQGAVSNCDKWMAKMEKEGGAKWDAGAAGKPAKLLFEYAANLYGEAGQPAGVCVEAGQALVKELLLVQAWDAEGRVVDAAKLSIEWSAAGGIELKDGALVAGMAAARATVTATEKGSGLSATQEVAVLGRPAKLAISPESVSIAQNQRQPLEARALDAAGNAVPVSHLKWTVSAGAGLGRPDSALEPGSPLEPHRNSYEAPEGGAGEVTVTAATADGALSATAKITVEKRKMDKLQSRAKAVSWENLSLEDAVKKAAQAGKPLLVEITASWCPFCKRFEEGPLSEDRVKDALKEWLAVQIDADKHPELVERYAVGDLPAVALLSPKGSLAGSFAGNLEPQGVDPRTTTDGLIQALWDAKRVGPDVDADEAKRVAEATSPAKMASLARWYYARIRWADAERWAREAMKADPKSADEMMPIAVRAAMSFGRNAEAAKEIEGYVGANPGSPAAAELMYRLGQAWMRMGDEDKAREVWGEIQKKWPTSAWGRKAAQAARK
jgi:thioredoxin-like negative regulator of GroEL